MKNLFKYATIFTAGFIGGTVYITLEVDKGEVIHEDDDIYVTAAKDKSSGYSYARVNYKHPQK